MSFGLPITDSWVFTEAVPLPRRAGSYVLKLLKLSLGIGRVSSCASMFILSEVASAVLP